MIMIAPNHIIIFMTEHNIPVRILSNYYSSYYYTYFSMFKIFIFILYKKFTKFINKQSITLYCCFYVNWVTMFDKKYTKYSY